MQSFGLGLRAPHYHDFLTKPQPVDWLEILSENYMIGGGKPLEFLDKIRIEYPMTMHGVSMSIASPDGLASDYLTALKKLADRVQPMWISDHLCWTGTHGKNLHDLLPMPFTVEALSVVKRNIEQAQDALGRALVLENISSYLQFEESEIAEWDFLSELTRSTGCKLLFDVNNWYVNAFNMGFDAKTTLQALPRDCVQQFHMAGHTDNGDHLIDTHDASVCDPVWQLYKDALVHFGPTPTMIERDDNIPPLQELLAELNVARKHAANVQKEYA
ncbi:MAG: DUF692 domain-containing protein [Limnobacter sp.]|nr:DUF692 domain-containing protein [Limnobacter sp.]